MNRFCKKFSSTFSTLVLMVILFSCSQKEVTIPEGILKKEELVPVLVDIHLAQTVVGMNQLIDSTGNSFNDYLISILEAHHVTKVEYESSLAFYAGHPDLLDGIYQEVINELSKKQGEVSVE